MEALQNFGGQMLVFGDDRYPKTLQQIEDAPPVLHYIGDCSMLSKQSIAIVGARNASANAKRFTMALANDLGQAGQIITSGLARGIDTAAHQSALPHGTVAVMAGGLDEVYPVENTQLYHDIVAQGCVVTEMPIGTKPTAHHFPRRNRIVSGLSQGVVVVEASIRSGSLITARLASEQGREVFAVPGFPGDPRGAGPNSLIQNGAKLVQCANDVLDELTLIGKKSIPQRSLFDKADIDEEPVVFKPTSDAIVAHDEILTHLSHTPLDIDQLVRQCGGSIGQIQTILLDMELTGVVQRHPGNRVSRIV